MEIPKKFFRDRLVLLLIAVNAFLTLLAIVLILFRLGDHSNGYFIQYRSNLGLNAYKVGNVGSLLSFVVFAILIFGFHTYLAIKTYALRRNLAVICLVFATLLLSLTIIISNALLVLR